MNVFSKRFVILLVINALLFFAAGYGYSHYNHVVEFQVKQPLFFAQNASVLPEIASVDGIKKLRFKEFVRSKAFESPSSLREYCNMLSASGIYSDSAMRVVFDLMTDSLLKATYDTLKYEPDELHSLLLWIAPFRNSGDCDTSLYSAIYPAIFDFWCQKVSIAVGEESTRDSDVKYEYYFAFLRQSAEDYGYIADIKVTNTEKVFQNIKKGNWDYLLDRFWNGTSIWIKLFIVAFFVALATLLAVLRSKRKRKVMVVAASDNRSA